MTTLLAVYNSEGCVGRCDEKCYAATSDPKRCECICGGSNHGVGLEAATTQSRAILEGVGLPAAGVQAILKRAGGRLEVAPELRQGDLFK